MFEESGAGGGARDSGTDDKGPVEAAAVAFEGSSSLCMAGRRLFRLDMPSKRESSYMTGLASK